MCRIFWGESHAEPDEAVQLKSRVLGGCPSPVIQALCTELQRGSRVCSLLAPVDLLQAASKFFFALPTGTWDAPVDLLQAASKFFFALPTGTWDNLPTGTRLVAEILQNIIFLGRFTYLFTQKKSIYLLEQGLWPKYCKI